MRARWLAILAAALLAVPGAVFAQGKGKPDPAKPQPKKEEPKKEAPKEQPKPKPKT